MTNRAQIWKPGDFSLGQVHEFMAAFGRAGGTPELLQLAIENKEKMRQIVLTFDGHLLYTDEQLKSFDDYPYGFRIRSVKKQVETLLEHFPDLDPSHIEDMAKGDLSEGAEGWAVIPKPEKIGNTYCEALAKVLGLFSKDCKFEKHHLSLIEETKQVHAVLNEHPGDFWVIPFQFGKRWGGRSVRNAQVNFAGNEFGFGPYEVAILLLTHPNRITRLEHLFINCAGCEYPADAESNFSCLGFGWANMDESVVLYCNTTDNAHLQWGVASGFLAQ